MSTDAQIRSASTMLDAGGSDESTERLTGVSLLEIIGLRAGRATAPPASPSRDVIAGESKPEGCS